MADHIEIFSIDSQIQIPIPDQTPPTEAIEDEIEGGKKVDYLIVEIKETDSQDLSRLQTSSESANQISEERFKSTTIFKVNVGLRESNQAAYTPMFLSIGPYHYKSPKLRSTEKYKQLYLKRFLSRKEGVDKESCMRELEKLKDKALMCYDDTENLDKDIVCKFSEIMLLDGCFLVEFIRESVGEKHYQEEVIDKAWMTTLVRRDMVVLENQLPFFVLTKLYDMTKRPDEASFLYMVIRTLLSVFPKATYIPKSEIDRLNAERFDHLLHVVHRVSCPLEMNNSGQGMDASMKNGFCNIRVIFGKILQIMKRSKENLDIQIPSATDSCPLETINSGQGMDASMKNGFCNIRVIFGKILQIMKRSEENLDLWQCTQIPSATELYEAGVSFTKIGSVKEDPEDTATLLDIKFENGLLEIPCFAVEDTAESFLRNLIAYEQHSSNVKTYFSDYGWIMSQLINSHKGAKLLRESGIILNYLGDDKAVASIFNRLGDGVQLSASFYYNEECSKIIQHCQKPWNKMMANLRHNYFQSPWAGASTVGAIILLILTTIQTVLAFTGGVR